MSKGADSQRALEIHNKAVVIDTHNDTLLGVLDKESWLPTMDIGSSTDLHLDIPKMEAGGLDVAFFAAFTGGYAEIGRSNSRLLALINALYWVKQMNQDKFGLATSVSEIHSLLHKGKIVGVPSIEGAYSLEEDNALELLRQYYDLGIRAIALCWSNSNSLGEGVDEKYPDGSVSQGGLTKLGAKVVGEMNKLGIIVDVSHMNDKTFWGVIEAAKAPVMASHSNAWGIYEHPRNLKDEQIVALAKTGGIVQQNFFTHYLGPEGDRDLKKLIDHIDHVVALVGIDYVGLGSDFDGAKMPDEVPNASYYYRITKELFTRGYGESDIIKILGANTLRVMQQVQDIAERVGGGNEKSNIIIEPAIKMGQGVNGASPILQANVIGINDSAANQVRFQAVVDGIKCEPEYDSQSNSLSVQIKEPLTEKFHVITFEAHEKGCKPNRETVIFHLL